MRVILIFSLLLLKLNLYSQDFPGLSDINIDTTRDIPVYRYRATGLSYQTTRDEALSPLVFHGFGSTFSGSSWKYSKKWLWQSVFNSHIYILENKPASSLMSEIGFAYEFSGLKEIPSIGKSEWRLWVGPGAGMFLNMRLHSRNVNNVGAYDWATALGVSALVSKKFSLFGRTFAISNQLQLPLVFLYARPPYAWAIPPSIYEGQEGSWKDAFKVGSLNEIILLNNQLNLDFHLPRRRKGKLVKYRAFRLAYTWKYFQVNTSNKLQTGGHLLSLSRALSN